MYCCPTPDELVLHAPCSPHHQSPRSPHHSSPHPHGRPDDEEEEQDADGPDGEEEEQDNGGAYDVADEDDWDVETDEDAGDGNPEDTHVSSGRSDEDDAGDIVIPVGPGRSYNDPIVLE